MYFVYPNLFLFLSVTNVKKIMVRLLLLFAIITLMQINFIIIILRRSPLGFQTVIFKIFPYIELLSQAFPFACIRSRQSLSMAYP